LSKRLGVSRSGNPHSNSRPDNRQSADGESELVVAGTIEQIASQKGAAEPAESTAAVGESENGSKMSARKEVRRNRSEQGNAHAESHPLNRIDQQQHEIVWPRERTEAPDTEYADPAAETEDPLTAPAVGEGAANQVANGREDP
jgi:hypothetical protein